MIEAPEGMSVDTTRRNFIFWVPRGRRMVRRGVLLIILLMIAAASMSVVTIQRFISKEDAVYEERLSLLCDTSFKAEGYPTADACAEANKTLRDAGQERDFFKDLLLDDRIYVCMLEHAARGVDMSDCINAYLNLSRFIRPEPRQPSNPDFIRPDLWKDMLQDKDASPPKSPDQSTEVAALKHLGANPGIAKSVRDAQYPPTASTRSLHLPEGMASLSYEDRVRELAKFGLDLRATHLAVPREMGVQDQIQALQQEGPVKQAFQRLFTDDDSFACILNNLLIGGDIGLCFYLYFIRHPDQYHAIAGALSITKGPDVPTGIQEMTLDNQGTLPSRTSSSSVDPMPTGGKGLDYGPFPEVSTNST